MNIYYLKQISNNIRKYIKMVFTLSIIALQPVYFFYF